MDAGGGESGAVLERGNTDKKKKRKRKQRLGDDGPAPPRLSESERERLVSEARRQIALVRTAEPHLDGSD